MKKVICALFDMDGVMIDTESQYDKFWKHTGERFGLGIQDFEKKIKGATLPGILKRFFSEYDEKDIRNISADLDKFEAQMSFDEIAGSVNFVKELKSKGVTVGLVTSSSITKMNGVNNALHFDELFDIVITAADIEHGKPAPDCFLLAAKKLNINPQDCIVFEDSFAGIEAGTAAGMTVIGLATTNSKESLESKCQAVIPNFEGFTLEKLEELR